jgi:hypothetical protein
MKIKELELINDYCNKKQLLTNEDIEKFIINNFSLRKKELMRFYLTDLFSSNIVYRLNSTHYKYNNNLVQYNYQNSDIDNSIKENIEARFPEMETCVWGTNTLTNFMNLQPYVTYTFVEVNSLYIEIVYDYLKNKYENILINPIEKELNHYVKGSSTIIIQKLPLRSPLDKPFRGTIGNVTNISSHISNVFNPRIEKIIVDIFVDKDKINLYGEIDVIIKGILKVYCVNFEKLFSYAHYRGIREELDDYIKYVINYDVIKGEFYD